MDLQYADIHNVGIINSNSINTNTGTVLSMTTTDTTTLNLVTTATANLPMDTIFTDSITFETLSIRDIYDNHNYSDITIAMQKMRHEINELKEEIKTLKKWEEI